MTQTNSHPLIACSYYISPDKIFIKKEYYKSNQGFSQSFIDNQINLSNHKPKGVVSDKSAQRIKSSINWLVSSAVTKRVTNPKTKQRFNFKINLLTLTLAQEQGEISDKLFKSKYLQPLLKRLKRKTGLKNYVWKAEVQSNGNIHIHLVTDKFIHYKVLQDMWNDILYKNGQLQKFFKKHGHFDPHSTEVKSVQKVKNLASYLIKYLTKKETDKRLIVGRLWGCNYALSQANKCSVIIEPKDVNLVKKDINFSALEHKVLESEPDQFGNTIKYGDLYFIKPSDWGKNIKGLLDSEYQIHLKQIRENGSQFFKEKRKLAKENTELKRENIRTALQLNSRINPNPYFDNTAFTGGKEVQNNSFKLWSIKENKQYKLSLKL